eukprot:TRINITY_DN102447_c0_g1_i1.p1 TRINITY_DN102447_c0_g1~~TRINITY_DN102447_c0_g1_i1.p1  ORF type:complete len:166 (+),score=17.34 TRINITY_DN102447_c0_g1_i1:51-548(+)
MPYGASFCKTLCIGESPKYKKVQNILILKHNSKQRLTRCPHSMACVTPSISLILDNLSDVNCAHQHTKIQMFFFEPTKSFQQLLQRAGQHCDRLGLRKCWRIPKEEVEAERDGILKDLKPWQINGKDLTLIEALDAKLQSLSKFNACRKDISAQFNLNTKIRREK